MPIYEFKCENCGNLFEERVEKIGQSADCPQCHSSNVKRLISIPAAFINKSKNSMCDFGGCPSADTCKSSPSACPGNMCGYDDMN